VDEEAIEPESDVPASENESPCDERVGDARGPPGLPPLPCDSQSMPSPKLRRGDME
jgi:hypothetical protein